MDVKEGIRRYLEQRREVGDTSIVFDALTRVETLALAAGARAVGAGVAAAGVASAPVVTGGTAAGSSGADWRAALREAGAPYGSTSEPSASRPSGSKPSASRPAASKPSTSKPAASKPSASRPAASKPAAPEPSGRRDGEEGAPPAQSLDSLGAIAGAIASCIRCPLHATATHPVPGEGDPNAKLVLVGEAPGATEDETGRPFVGAAGQLLTRILAAIELQREQVFICNVLKHRPPGNRNPLPDEVRACSPYLIRQIELIRPRVIIALGTFAAQTLLDTKLTIGKLRGQIHHYHGVPLVVTYHPAALLRNPAWKRPAWDDVQLARQILDGPDDR